ncbi:MAG: ABC transporter ATP-binding protein, partial [Thiovulaceae bacterium]|nr:ABC transporter ATP-binding protein [Sulfurimonadaceae bacterium]
MKIKRLQVSLNESRLVDIEFTIKRSLALVGQSGSGKSLTLKALLGMLPSQMALHLEQDADFVLERGRTVAFVPQNPFTALSPLTKIKDQFFVD